MEDQIYETEDNYTLEQIVKIEKWFSDEIGTEYERNESASGLDNQYYLLMFDLTHSEVIKIRNAETLVWMKL
jgi:hypothetical protein